MHFELLRSDSDVPVFSFHVRPRFQVVRVVVVCRRRLLRAGAD